MQRFISSESCNLVLFLKAFFSVIFEGCNQRHQDRQGCGNELTLGDENMAGERKKGCCPPSSSHDSAAAPVHSSRNTHHQGR